MCSGIVLGCPSIGSKRSNPISSNLIVSSTYIPSYLHGPPSMVMTSVLISLYSALERGCTFTLSTEKHAVRIKHQRPRPDKYIRWRASLGIMGVAAADGGIGAGMKNFVLMIITLFIT